MTMLKNILANTDHMSIADLQYWLNKTQKRMRTGSRWLTHKGQINGLEDIATLKRVLAIRERHADE